MDPAKKSLAANVLCSTWVSACPAVRNDWRVPLPPDQASPPVRPAPSGKEPIRIVHLSDIHIDPDYMPGATTECKRPDLCCRVPSKMLDKGKKYHPAGTFGHPRKCDTPHALEKSMYEAIASHVPDAKFAIFTGGILPRNVWNSSAESTEHQSNPGLPCLFPLQNRESANKRAQLNGPTAT
jgi:sphingomyelin phosphodiesterase